MDFITDLPPSSEFYGIYTCFDRLTKFIELLPDEIGDGVLSTTEVACFFFDNIVCFFGIPEVVFYDHSACFIVYLCHCL